MDYCRLCGKPNLHGLLDFGEHPIAHRFLSDPFEEEYVHPVILCLCEGCGLAQLVNPIPPKMLYTEYNWLSSWKWNPHLARLLQLIEKLPDVEKTSRIVEVGSNDGSFIKLLHERGYEKVLGVEPAQDGQEAARQKGVETIGAYFTQETAQEIVATFGKCDLFMARQVLEHITELEEFREAMCILLRPGGYVLIEVPNFGFSLSAPDYSAIWEEHVNYFTLQTLTRFLADVGVWLIHDETAIFSGEAIIVVGRCGGTVSSTPMHRCSKELREKTFAYRDRWPVFRKAFGQFLHKHQTAGEKVVVYGAGSRACSLINFAGVSGYIEFIVDDQPEKQGKYMAGSRLPVLPGETLETHLVDLCLLAVNAENEEKLIARHRTYEEKGGRFASMLPPSNRLLPFWNHV